VLPDERTIVERARAGDKRAFERLYRAYAPTLYAHVLVPMLGDRDDAHDCLRETFLAAHRAIADYEWRGSGIYPWLKVLAKNKARDHLRASERRIRLRGAFAHYLEVLRHHGDPTDAPEQDALRSQIEVVLTTLNPRYARVLRLRMLEDRDRDECARLLEIKVGTLDVLVFRACRAFRIACERHGTPLREVIDGVVP